MGLLFTFWSALTGSLAVGMQVALRGLADMVGSSAARVALTAAAGIVPAVVQNALVVVMAPPRLRALRAWLVGRWTLSARGE